MLLDVPIDIQSHTWYLTSGVGNTPLGEAKDMWCKYPKCNIAATKMASILIGVVKPYCETHMATLIRKYGAILEYELHQHNFSSFVTTLSGELIRVQCSDCTATRSPTDPEVGAYYAGMRWGETHHS